MAREIPRTVRAGEVVSAAWLNSIIDYLRYLNEQQSRRRLLRGVGYQVKESPGGTSLTIDKQAVTRVCDDELDILRNEDFQLRIKPKGQCAVDEETGHWDKVLQVHQGRITDHHGNYVDVTELEKEDGSQVAIPSGGTAWDSSDWLDVGVLKVSQDEGGEGEKEISVFVRLTLHGTQVEKAVFVTKEDASTGDMYVRIGKASVETVEELPRYYFSQYHQGPIELGGESSSMPFDTYMSTEMEGDDPENQEKKYYLKIAGGNVFLPNDQYAVIPEKTKLPIDVTSGTGYVCLTLMRQASGELKYQYSIKNESELGTAVSATEDKGEGANE